MIIPVFNEEKTIQRVLDTLFNIEFMTEMSLQCVVVDDCSRDLTVQIVNQYTSDNPYKEITFIQHEVNRGKGAALRAGIAEATGDFIIVQDADLEYDPNEYNLLLKPMIEGRADVVYGSRFMGGRPHRILFFWHSIGNKFLTMMSNAATNLNLTDMETCYKLFKADIIKGIELKENRFGFEPEVTAKIARIPGIRIYEVGISYYGRTYAEGKKINWRDGFRALWCILKYGFFRMQ